MFRRPTTDFLVEDASQPTGYQMTFPEGTDLTPYGPLGPLFQEHIGPRRCRGAGRDVAWLQRHV
ncbi:MAG: hypothetical protein IPL19_29605 [Sandaracinaceae bacterium]|nr:hypothetical protein [Sandaracinaceae bacterium]